MARSKPPLLRLSELTPGQHADCFVLLAERVRNATREGKPYFACRFRDAQRVASCMIWQDGGWFEACETSWREGQFYKVRLNYGEHERFGPQIEIHNIREVNDDDKADGFAVGDFMPRSRFDPEVMFAELRALGDRNIADEGLRRLVGTILERHAAAFKQLPATQRHFYTFPGGLLEHTLSVTNTCIDLAERYMARYPELKPPLNRDLVVAAAMLHDIGRVLEFGDDALALQQTVP